MTQQKKYKPEDIDKVFVLNKDSYPKDFEPVYKQYLEPVELIQFPTLLPFHVSVSEGACMTIPRTDKHALQTFIFNSIETTSNIGPRIISPDVEKVPIRKSRVEMVHVASEKIAVDEGSLSDTFDELIYDLNAILMAHLITSKDSDIHRISREMLPFMSVFRVADLPAWKKCRPGLFLLHWDVPYIREPLDPPSENQLLWFVRIMTGGLNPFLLSEELALNSMREMKKGFYRDAVIHIQTSVEAFLSVLMLNFFSMEGKTTSEAEEMLEKIPFISILKKELHPRIGGKWDISNESHVVGEWHKKLYLMRNKIIHAGYQPLFPEASEAIDAGLKLRLYIVDLVKKANEPYGQMANLLVKDWEKEDLPPLIS